MFKTLRICSNIGNRVHLYRFCAIWCSAASSLFCDVEQQTLSYTLTSSIHHCQHDGGDPRHLAGGGSEDNFYLFEKHSDGFGEGIGEANGDEGPYHHCPAPSTFWRCITCRPTQCWSHVCSPGRCRPV